MAQSSFSTALHEVAGCAGASLPAGSSYDMIGSPVSSLTQPIIGATRRRMTLHTESVGASWSEDGYELLLSAIGCSAVWRTVGPPARRAMGATGR